MIECCHRKAVRFKIDEERACRLFGVEDRWEIENLLNAPFEIAPTEEFYVDYNLPCSDCTEGDWGKSRTLYDSEFNKYEKLFGKLFNYQLRLYPTDFRVVEYCYYDCSEAPDYFNEPDDFYKEV